MPVNVDQRAEIEDLAALLGMPMTSVIRMCVRDRLLAEQERVSRARRGGNEGETR